MDEIIFDIYRNPRTADLMSAEARNEHKTRLVLQNLQKADSLVECRQIAAKAVGNGWEGPGQVLTQGSIISLITTIESYIPQLVQHIQAHKPESTDEQVKEILITQILGPNGEIIDQINAVLERIRNWRPDMLESRGMATLKPNLLEGLAEDVIDITELIYIMEKAIHNDIIKARRELQPAAQQTSDPDEATGEITDYLDDPTIQ